MSKIEILPESVANQIAAGEVVERPASVVKEWLDNAVDAQASQIKIEIEKGGIQKILVTDNGTGMDEEDVNKCCLRHGTSKIATAEDLFQIKTLGFRGEALASIAAVSKLTIRSKTLDQSSGMELKIEGGKRLSLKPVGMPQGTTVLAEALFFNLPARKKFLKTLPTELHHITDTIIDQALAHAEIGFQLFHQERSLLHYPNTVTKSVDNLLRNSKDKISKTSAALTEDTMALRIKQVLGNSIFSELIPVYFDHPHIQISGWVSKPQISHDSRYKQYLFVNGRRINDRGLTKAVKDAFGSLLPAKIYPIFVLYLKLPFDMVDVNVHPRKEEVRFVNSGLVYNSIRKSVSHALENADLTFSGFSQTKEVDFSKDLYDLSLTPSISPLAGESDRSYKRNAPHDSLPFQEAGWGDHSILHGRFSQSQKDFTHTINQHASRVSEPILPWGSDTETMYPILQIHNLYLITQSNNGLLIVDQHAAHERVLYEKLLINFQAKKNLVQKQNLLIPAEFDLSINEADILRENLKILDQLGFEIKSKGKGNHFQILSVPAILSGKNLIRIITEVISDLKDEQLAKNIDDQSLRALTFLACRSAVKAGDKLSGPEARHIIEALEKTQIKYTCPHGRPVKVEISLKDLEKMFGRL